MKIGIIDYNIGNIGSIQNAFNALGIEVNIEKNPLKLKTYDKLILPGVGAFGTAIESLKHTGMKEGILEFVKTGKYILGVCLGMQLLLNKSYEFGENEGLGLIEGEVILFKSQNLKIPHMGWNKITLSTLGSDNSILKNIANDSYLYFVHSYHCVCDEKFVLAYCQYGYQFPALIAKDNILGIQPHPEKSHQNGLMILKNFTEL